MVVSIVTDHSTPSPPVSRGKALHYIEEVEQQFDRIGGWLYLAVVMDLHARKIVGWSMKPTLARELVLDALLMAVWRRKPHGRVLVHSDQGTQPGLNWSSQHCFDAQSVALH